jgi:hypothetical protein
MRDIPERSAASVASRLLDFCREPALYRPRYLRGLEPMPEGTTVLKFAAGHFPSGWQRDLPSTEQSTVSAAARAFIRQVCLWDGATHYQVLCVAPGAPQGAIRENYRLLMALLHPDRLEAGQEDWPLDAAQRVNRAHDVLSDGRERESYDVWLRQSGERTVAETARRIPVSEPFATSRRHAAPRLRRAVARAAVLAGVIGGLYVVQQWWFVERPREILAESSFVVTASDRWVRDTPPSVAPRFLAGTDSSAPSELLAPIEPAPEWRPLAGPRVPEEDASPRVLAPAVATIQVVAGVPLASANAAPANAPGRRTETPSAVTQASAGASPPLKLAQAVAAPSPSGSPTSVPGAPNAEQVETLVAQLVGSWDAGDADRLMGLLDSDEYGIWKGWRTRSAYSDFFESTRQRRLRMNRLEWRAEGLAARARGEATLLAEFQDGRPRLERTVPVELDIAIRGGHARITRIVLYPVGQ